MNTLSRSWQLVKASAAVLKADKELIVFPIVSGIAVLILTISFALPMLLTGVVNADNGSIQPIFYLVTFLFYLAQYFVIFLCNTALVGAALIRLRGGDPTVTDGWRIASSRLSKIFGYAIIAATLGMILRVLSEKAGVLGKLVISLIGFVWNVATFLVVPILAVEGIGPIDAVKRSVELLKRTWGEQLAGNFGMGAFFGLIFFLVILLGIGLIILAVSLKSVAVIIIASLVFLFALIVITLISSALNGIYTAALYQYAISGQFGDYFAPDMVQNAFTQKK
jgi:hypothetical protein